MTADMDENFAYFGGLLAAACHAVSAEYFQLPIAAGDAVYRERVYCYELYHRMRQEWGQFPFSLGGEIDKNGHPLFRTGPYAQAKPDFLVHVPGSMDGNLACVEVKPSTASTDALVQDLSKLSWFCTQARYRGGILLIYGEESETRSEAILGEALRREAEVARIDLSRIHIMRHRTIGHEATRVGD